MLRLSLLIIVVAALAGCGKSSDPVQSSANASVYGALRANTVPGSNYHYKTFDQSTAPNNFLAITILNQDKNAGNFVEEKAGEVQFQITPFPGISSYVVTSTNNPAGSSIRQSTTPNVWLFDWTPPAGTVDANQSLKLLNVHLVVAPNTTDTRFVNMVSEKDIQLSVVKIRSSPVVVSINDASNGKVDEGGTYDFSVTVIDPSEINSPPTIAISPYSPENKEDIHHFGFIQPNPKDAVPSSGGRWEEFYKFSTAGIDLSQSVLVKDYKGNTKQDNFVQICANFTAISVAKVASANSLGKCWTVALAAQAPHFNFVGAPITESILQLTAGPGLKVEFTGTIPNKRGTAKVEVTDRNFEKWPGHPSYTCDNADATIKNCSITWEDPCKAAGKYTLHVQGTNTDAFVNNKLRTSNDSRQIVINPATTGCAQPAPAAAATAPAAPVTKTPATTTRVARQTAGAVTGVNAETVPAVMNPGSDSPANFVNPNTKTVSQTDKAKAKAARAAKLKAAQAAQSNSTTSTNVVAQTPATSSSSPGGAQ